MLPSNELGQGERFLSPPICKAGPLSSTKSRARAQQKRLWEATQIDLNWVGKTLPICLFWLWCQPVKACEDRDITPLTLWSPTWHTWCAPGEQDVRGGGSAVAPRLPPPLLARAWCRTEPWNAGGMQPMVETTLEPPSRAQSRRGPCTGNGAVCGLTRKGESGCLWGQKRSELWDTWEY